MKKVSEKVIAYIYTDFKEKFGIPRQGGVAESTTGRIVFEEPYRDPEALRGLDEFTYIWVIWDISENHRSKWSPTVRPPRLGGNERIGVFASRSPFRPNSLGLSCLKILNVELNTENGPIITVEGPDMLSGTPILDIKPYIPYADAHPEAKGGFTDHLDNKKMDVEIPFDIAKTAGLETAEKLADVLSNDPRPRYHHDDKREYGMLFSDYNVKFRAEGDRIIVTGIEVAEEKEDK